MSAVHRPEGEKAEGSAYSYYSTALGSGYKSLILRGEMLGSDVQGQETPENDDTLGHANGWTVSFSNGGNAVSCTRTDNTGPTYTRTYSGCTFDRAEYSFHTLDDSTPDKGKGVTLTFSTSSNPGSVTPCTRSAISASADRCCVHLDVADNDNYIGALMQPASRPAQPQPGRFTSPINPPDPADPTCPGIASGNDAWFWDSQAEGGSFKYIKVCCPPPGCPRENA